MTVLYHLTTRDCAESILAAGFRNSEEGCWLSPDPSNVCGHQSSAALLRVTLDVPESALASYRRVVEEEAIDGATDEVVWDDFPTAPYPWYAVPAGILNAMLRSCEVVTGAERQAIMERLDT